MTTPWVPGQVIVGSKVNAAPNVFTNEAVFQHIPHAGGTSPKAALFGLNSGTGASVSAVTGYDGAGNFTITAGTGSLAGTMASVTFGRALSAAPSSVNVTVADSTAGASTNVVAGGLAFSKTGFSVYSGTALTLAHTYLVSYQVWQ